MKIFNKSGLPLPKYETKGSAGLDLRASEDVLIFDRGLVPTGLYVAVPEGYEGTVRGRSGLTMKGIDVALGTIDSDYRGEVKIMVINNTSGSILIKRGDRIAQLVISRVRQEVLEEVDELDSTERGDGGFGSTGV